MADTRVACRQALDRPQDPRWLAVVTLALHQAGLAALHLTDLGQGGAEPLGTFQLAPGDVAGVSDRPGFLVRLTARLIRPPLMGALLVRRHATVC